MTFHVAKLFSSNSPKTFTKPLRFNSFSRGGNFNLISRAPKRRKPYTVSGLNTLHPRGGFYRSLSSVFPLMALIHFADPFKVLKTVILPRNQALPVRG